MSEQISLRKRLQRPVFWGSLLLNAILIGVLLFGPSRGLPHPPPRPETFLLHMGKDLRGQDKAFFGTLVAKYKLALEQQGSAMHSALDGVAASAQKDPFDEAAFRSAHQQVVSNKNLMDEKIDAFILELVLGLSSEGRKTLQLKPPHEK